VIREILVLYEARVSQDYLIKDLNNNEISKSTIKNNNKKFN
jgi:hypothetical protein